MKTLPPRRKKNFSWWLGFAFLLALFAAAATWWWQRKDEVDELFLQKPIAWREFSAKETLFGRELAIRLYVAEDAATPEKAAREAFAIGRRIETLCNPWEPDSDISKLNNAPPHKEITLNPDFLALLEQALELADITSGTYNPAIGKIHTLWDERLKQQTLPQDAEINGILPTCDWRALQINTLTGKAVWNRLGVSIELGNIALGFALDEMLKTLTAKGYPHASILAEDAACAGLAPPGETHWLLPLHKYDSGVLEALPLKQCALVTVKSHWRDNGSTPNIISPTTGHPPEGKITLQLLASHGGLAQPLASIAACDLTQIKALCTNNPTIAWRFSRVHKGQHKMLQSPNFPLPELIRPDIPEQPSATQTL